jgi:nucleotide-binding universal stress UspA family protein
VVAVGALPARRCGEEAFVMAMLPALHLLVVTPDAVGPHAPVVRAIINPAAVARVTVLAVAPPPHQDPLFRLGNALGVGVSQSAFNHLMRSNEGVAWAASRRVAADLGDLAPRVRPMVRTGPPVDQALAVADEEQVDLIVIGGALSQWPSLGSGKDVAAELVRRATHPVLVLPNREGDVTRQRSWGSAADWRRVVAAWQHRLAGPGGLRPQGSPA